jgi:hypothetical protein
MPGFRAENRHTVVLPAYADDQDVGVEPVHDVVRKPDVVVHQGRLAVAALHEERWRFAHREPGRRLDVGMLPAVKAAQRRHLNRRPGVLQPAIASSPQPP